MTHIKTSTAQEMVTMKRHWPVHLVVLVLAGVACGVSEDGGGARPAAQAFTIEVDGRADGFSAGFSAFFPDHVAVHPGDTVTVKLNAASGQPHTATLGTLVDAAEAHLDHLGPEASLAAQENSPEMLRLPDPFPHEVTGGPQDANQSAAQPCYLDTGVPPLSLTGGAPACPRRDQPTFDGTQSFYNGGLLMAAGDAFTVRLATTIKPGTYSLMCMGHRSAGIGHITVVSAEEPVPTPAEAAAEGRRQRQHLVDLLRPVAAQADRSTPDTALAGAGDPNVYNALVTQFGPQTISIPVEGTATWHVNGFHTISFGAPASAGGSFIKEPDGSVHLNPEVMLPAGYEVPDAAFVYPPPDDGQPVVIDGGRWDGVGFRSTGLVGSYPPVLVKLRQTFTKAGTYPYRCLFHPAMAGAVKVG
jgi:plastocyanin